ncbi:hypothetical protein Vafri_1767 [Volvox africanus]|nr:hypothetical protein Vafri_1767 [Volvox africanus]
MLLVIFLAVAFFAQLQELGSVNVEHNQKHLWRETSPRLEKLHFENLGFERFESAAGHRQQEQQQRRRQRYGRVLSDLPFSTNEEYATSIYNMLTSMPTEWKLALGSVRGQVSSSAHLSEIADNDQHIDNVRLTAQLRMVLTVAAQILENATRGCAPSVLNINITSQPNNSNNTSLSSQSDSPPAACPAAAPELLQGSTSAFLTSILNTYPGGPTNREALVAWAAAATAFLEEHRRLQRQHRKIAQRKGMDSAAVALAQQKEAAAAAAGTAAVRTATAHRRPQYKPTPSKASTEAEQRAAAGATRSRRFRRQAAEVRTGEPPQNASANTPATEANMETVRSEARALGSGADMDSDSRSGRGLMESKGKNRKKVEVEKKEEGEGGEKVGEEEEEREMGEQSEVGRPDAGRVSEHIFDRQRRVERPGRYGYRRHGDRRKDSDEDGVSSRSRSPGSSSVDGTKSSNGATSNVGRSANQSPAIPADFTEVQYGGLPLVRRVLLAQLLLGWVEALQMQLVGTAQVAVEMSRLVALLYDIHVESVAQRAIVEYFHISKAGGTSWYTAARGNGCRSPPESAGRVSEFDDECRWINGTLMRQLQVPVLRNGTRQ